LITLFDVQLEQISLASIIIALGLLVDNAVQVCDQSRSNQIDGMGPREATIAGSNQLAGPMLNGTATTIAAFFPMLIGLVGSKKEYVYSLPVTLSVTLAISWILAMTFCSILAASFIRPPADPNKPSAPLGWLLDKIQRMFSGKNKQDDSNEPPPDLIGDLFKSTVKAALKAKFVTIGVAVALLFGAIMLPISSEFFPKDLRDQFAVEIWLPETASLEQTNTVALQVEEILRKLSPNSDSSIEHKEKIRAMRTMVGGGGSRWYLGWDSEPRKPNFAEILIRTTDAQFTSDLAKELRSVCEQGNAELKIKPIVGARIIPQELFLGPSADPVEIRVFGDGFADMQVLQKNAALVKQMIRDQPGTWDVNDSWGIPGYQLRVEIDEEKANRAGVTNAHVANTLNAYFSGQRLTTFREGDHQIPVFLRLGHDERRTLDRIHTAYVEGINGKVPLTSIATILPRWEPATIDRRDLNRVIEVRSQVEPGVMGNDIVNNIMASDEMKQLEKNLPDGFRIEVGGTLEKSQESAEQMGVCFSISILVIVLCLVIQYNGWVKPIIILSTLPMALIGALPGLYFTGNPLGFMSQLGILALFGIVLNTGIIFMEFADTRIKEAAEKSDGSGPIVGLTKNQFRNCLVDACYMRLLPIFLTTATTIGGLIPLALAGGPLWEGLAWAMIAGLMVATVLTLLVIPAMYAVFVETFGLKPVRLEE
jgi:multidrug efflux pump subunit AcrB